MFATIFTLGSTFSQAQSSADFAEIMELSLKNETVQSYFKKKIHISKESYFSKSLNEELKKKGIRISSKADLLTRNIKHPVMVESLKVKKGKAKLRYVIDGHYFLYKLKQTESGWKVRKSKES